MEAELKWPDGTTRRFVHRGSKADTGVLKQIFETREYSLHRLVRAVELNNLYLSYANDSAQPFIVDGGANIGASAVWFAMQFPAAKVIAFEPDKQNFELLETNCAGLQVKLHQAALGAHNGTANIRDPGLGEWGYRVEPDEHGKCEVKSLAQVIHENIDAGGTPYIVKLDIEGGEKDVFQEPNDWVDRVPLLIVELHDWLLPRQGTSRSFLQCIAGRDRDFVHIGENIFSIRNA